MSESVEVCLKTWNDDFAQLAELIFVEAQLAEELRPKIVLAGYSWGGGRGVITLAKELRRRGLGIQRVDLCDAVYFSPYPLWVCRALGAFRDQQVIRIPPNVRHVTFGRQTQSEPNGHPVVAKNTRRTTIEEEYTINADHIWADDDHQWHERVCRSAAKVIGQ